MINSMQVSIIMSIIIVLKKQMKLSQFQAKYLVILT
jgi:hypothetical protein